MAIANEDSPVIGSQRARQGQNVRGMRKVLIWGTLLTAIGFAVLLLLFSAWESKDPSPQADIASESNATPPVADQPPSQPLPAPNPP